MIDTYKEYLEAQKTLSFEDMNRIYEELIKDLEQDEDTKEFWEDFKQKAIQYANIRSNWCLLTREQKLDTDSSRTSTHNSLIIRLNILARHLKSLGKECKWRDELGYEEDDKYNRKKIGDFACFIAFISAINAR